MTNYIIKYCSFFGLFCLLSCEIIFLTSCSEEEPELVGKALITIEPHTYFPDHYKPEIPRDYSKYRLIIKDGYTVLVDTLFGELEDGKIILDHPRYFGHDIFMEYVIEEKIIVPDERLNLDPNLWGHGHYRYGGFHNKTELRVAEGKSYHVDIPITIGVQVIQCFKPLEECYEAQNN